MQMPHLIQSNVLIVDDDPATRTSLKAIVESFGHGVTVASSGEEAYASMLEHHYRIIISDWEMPGMNGLELCCKIRHLTSARYTYFILLTSHESPEYVVRGLEAGADDFITKPYNPAELRMRIKSAERIDALDTMDVTIYALAKLAESRDPETGEHLDRVRQYTRMIANELRRANVFEDVNEEYVRLMYETSPLHDIGKVAIPDSILLKPGHLNDQEYAIMKTHTVTGADTLKAALERYPEQRYLQIAHDIARSHHEWYDGSGYPDGLAGDDIPLAARIMALADVYDALTSKRVYKEAYTHKIASDIIEAGADTHFDPRIVQAYQNLEKYFKNTHSTHNDHTQRAA